MGPAYKRPHPGSWSTTCLLGSKTDTWYRVKAPGEDALTALLGTNGACFPVLYFTLHWDFFVSFLPALCCGSLPHLSPDGWALYPQHLVGKTVVSFLSLLKLLLLTDLSLGTLVSDHLCALPVKTLGWAHYQCTGPNDFLSRGVLRWHTCAVFQASPELR